MWAFFCLEDVKFNDFSNVINIACSVQLYAFSFVRYKHKATAAIAVRLKNKNKRPSKRSFFESVMKDMEPHQADVVLLPFYTIVVLVGIPGNVFFITVVKRSRFMHTTTNFLLANIAVADVITLVFCVPGVILQFAAEHHPRGVLGDFLCKFVTMHHVSGATLLVSGISLTLISIERHNALLRPMDETLRLRKKHVFIAVCLIWTFSIGFVMPLFVEQKYVEEVAHCHMDWKASVSKAYWGLLAVITMLSLLIMLACYFRIVKGILCDDILASDSSQGKIAKEQDIQSKKKIVKLLITVTVIFIACFVPFATISAMSVSVNTLAYKVSYFLVYCSCSLNPVVYAFQSSNYRMGVKNVCGNGRRRIHAISGNDGTNFNMT